MQSVVAEHCLPASSEQCPIPGMVGLSVGLGVGGVVGCFVVVDSKEEWA